MHNRPIQISKSKIVPDAGALRLTLLVILLGTLFGCTKPTTEGAARQQAGPLVLRGGLLIDGTGKAPVENSLVLMDGGKIQRVGHDGDFPVPAGATVLDATGKTIIPGMMNSHTHLNDMAKNSDFYRAVYLAWGITTLGDLGNIPPRLMKDKIALDNGTLLGPNILAVVRQLDKPPKVGKPVVANVIEPRLFVKNEAELSAAILEMKRSGASAIKIYSELVDSPLFKPAVDMAHNAGLPIFAHVSSPGGVSDEVGRGTDEVIDSGLDMYVHTFGLEKATVTQDVRDKISRGELTHAQHLMDTSKFPALAQKMVDHKMFLNPTLTNVWGKFSSYRSQMDFINTDFLGGPFGTLIPAGTRSRYIDIFKPYNSAKFPEKDEAEGYKRVGQFVKIFVNKGGKVVAGTNEGLNYAPGMGLLSEMQVLKDIGLTPMQVIQAVTLWSFEAWRKGGEAGSIEAGKRADVVVLNRNPLEDIPAVRDIHMVIKDGKVVDRDALAHFKEPTLSAAIQP